MLYTEYEVDSCFTAEDWSSALLATTAASELLSHKERNRWTVRPGYEEGTLPIP